jgi:ankyrin repeat protein
MMKKILYTVGMMICLGISYYAYDKYKHRSDIVLDAVLSKNIDATKFLLEKNHNINKKYEYGHTLLHCAALSGNYEMVKLLVEKHALLLKNDFGLTAVDSARDMGNERILIYLKQHYKL